MAYPAYRLYFWGAFARGAALWMQIVALPWIAVELGAGPASVAAIVAVQYVPALVIAPLGGVIADRVRRVNVLQATQGAVAVLGCVTAVLLASGVMSVTVLAVVGLALGVVTAIDLPVRQAFMADLVPEPDVASAASLHSTAWNTSRFIGPGIAGLLIGLIGIVPALLTSAALIGAVTLSYLVLARRLPHEQPRATGSETVLRSLRDAMDGVAASTTLRLAFLVGTAGHVLGAQVFQSLAPSFVSDVLELRGGEFGFFMAAWGLGAVIASYVVTILANRRERWMAGGAAGIAVGFALLGSFDVAIVAFPMAGLIGFMQIVVAQNAVVTVQSAALGPMRGRVLGLYASLLHGVSPLGAVIAGAFAELAGIRLAMVGAAGGLLAVASLLVLARRRRTEMPDARPSGVTPLARVTQQPDEPQTSSGA